MVLFSQMQVKCKVINLTTDVNVIIYTVDHVLQNIAHFRLSHIHYTMLQFCDYEGYIA